MLISVSSEKLETINTISDAANQVGSDLCMCFWNNQNVIKKLLSTYTVYTIPLAMIPFFVVLDSINYTAKKQKLQPGARNFPASLSIML